MKAKEYMKEAKILLKRIERKRREAEIIRIRERAPSSPGFSDMPDFMKGLAKGINKSKKYVEAAVSGVADAMTLTMQSGLNVDMDGISGAMMNGGSSGVVNNYYNNDNSRTVNQTNNSPKSLSRLEIYRQTRNALNI